MYKLILAKPYIFLLQVQGLRLRKVGQVIEYPNPSLYPCWVDQYLNPYGANQGLSRPILYKKLINNMWNVI